MRFQWWRRSASAKMARATMSMPTLRRAPSPDRKSTRLNSSHLGISYAVFCLKKKKKKKQQYTHCKKKKKKKIHKQYDTNRDKVTNTTQYEKIKQKRTQTNTTRTLLQQHRH